MVAANTTPVNLPIIAGLPYNRRFRLVNGVTVWPTVDDFEVRSHMRTRKTDESTLLMNLRQFLTPAIDGQDITVTLAMTGAQTRTLPKVGYYDVVLSDIGNTDSRAILIVPASKITVKPMVTGLTDA